MDNTCELFKLIPKEKIDFLFKNSKTICAELNYEFLGFEEVYKAVTLFVPKERIIIDFGCAYGFQSWYFKDYKKYIGVDNCTNKNDVFRCDNSQFYFTSIQEFITKIFPNLNIKTENVFAICSYVPDGNARELVRNYFPYCLVYYPTN